MQSKLNPALEGELRGIGVVPVLTVQAPEEAGALARALVAGGLTVLEVTMRTPQALPALRAMIAAVPGALVGAGTVRDPAQADAAIAAGAKFLVAPGMTPMLMQAAERWQVPFLPGIATASEAMALHDLGYRVLKFFPAEPAGGTRYVQALAAPLPGLSFCPTGGIDAANAANYLALANVACVGGSWVAPAAAVASGDWQRITQLARDARQLARR